MTAKRRRKQTRPSAPDLAAAANDDRSEDEVQADRTGDSDEETSRRGGFLSRRGVATIPSPYPPFALSVAVGLRAVGSSPVILTVSFLSVLAVWGLFAALDVPISAGPLAGVMALPPLHLLFDIRPIQAVAQESGQLAVLAVGVVALRALILGLLALLVVQAVGEGRVDPRAAARRLPRGWAAMAQIYILEVALIVGAPLVLQGFLGPQFGQFGIVLVLVFGLHFLVLAPVVVAAEGARAQEALRLSWRAARLPGLRHFGLVLAYFFLVLYVMVPVWSAGLQPVTPSILVWAFSLVATVVHVGVLGAFAYRWLAVRDEKAVGRAAVTSPGAERQGARARPAQGRKGSGATRPQETSASGRGTRRRSGGGKKPKRGR